MALDIGPRHLILGQAPHTALGAGMLAVGYCRRVVKQVNHRTKVGMDVTGAESLDALYYLSSSIDLQIDVPRSLANGVRSFVPYIDTDDEYLAAGTAVTPTTICLVHPNDASSGTAGTSANTLWYPAAYLVDQGDEEYDGANDGADDSTFVTLTFRTAYITTHQDGSTAVPRIAQPEVPGDKLSDHSLDTVYLVPTPYGPAA